MKKILLFLILCLLSFSSPVHASENQYVTIVNPVRIASYTKDSSKSISSEYKIIHDNALPATWLLTYDVLTNEDDWNALATFDRNQELGIFLEITPSLCVKAGVPCNSGSWHHANVIFLSGYTTADRKKLIDTMFSQFKELFGYYPKSVGSWWTDAYSLQYMKEKYGITTNLTCSDQFSTDGYEIWGQYWMYPYMPSKYHAGIPGARPDNQLDLVTIQWAAREPLFGYESSLYSTQDYQTKPLNYTTDFFDSLVKTYALRHNNSFGQITVGLEGDFNPDDYSGEYTKQIQLVKHYSDQNIVVPVTMSQFSDWYRKSYKQTQSMFVQSDDTSETNIKSYWYQSPQYRINIVYNPDLSTATIRDFRSYHSDLLEPYYSSQNSNQKLTITVPSYFDAMNDKKSVWDLQLGQLQNVLDDEYTVSLTFTDGKIILGPTSYTIQKANLSVPSILTKSNALTLEKGKDELIIRPNENWQKKEDSQYWALPPVTIHELFRKRTIAIIGLSFLILLFIITTIIIKIKNKKAKVISVFLVLMLFSVIPLTLYCQNLVRFSVSQSELDVLHHVSTLPKGNVLVYDHECLGCVWDREYEPASYANTRGYVSKYGKHPLIYNKNIFEETDLQKAKQEFNHLNIQYIYLTRYEGFEEKLPFSPGDFNIEKVYESANGELWRVKTN